MRTIDLIKSPKQILCCSIDIIASRVIGEVIPQGRPTEFRFEKIDLVEEEDNAGSHEPSRIDDRIKQHKTFHHSILQPLSVLGRHV